MQHDQRLLELLAAVPTQTWEGEVFRHMFADYPPEKENTSGARWNLPQVPAIYTSLARETVLAEANHHISMQPIRPRAKRTLYTISIKLANILDISAAQYEQVFGLDAKKILAAPDMEMCQRIGSAAAHLGHDGLIVRSARATGLNLVIYPNNVNSDHRFEVVRAEIISPGGTW